MPRRVVWKFGGTSVGDLDRLRAVAERLVAARHSGAQVVAVLSAMGQTTDELIAMSRQLSSRPPPRELDTLLSLGESMSCALAAMAVHELGERAVSLSGAQAGVLTDSSHGDARLLRVDPQRVVSELDNGAIVLVAGYQGVSANNDITTLGRGGSDLSAIALAVALGLEHCEIFTDVSGIFTADPRMVPTARQLDRISHDEMLPLAEAGAQVMQARAVALAGTHGLDVHVRSSRTAEPGTWITAAPSASGRGPVAGVAYHPHDPIYTIPSQALTAAMLVLQQLGARVDSVTPAGDWVHLTASGPEIAEVVAALGHVGIDVRPRGDLGSVSVVGAAIDGRPEIRERVLAALRRAAVVPHLVADAPSRIICHVATETVGRATQLLHDEFIPHAEDDDEPTYTHSAEPTYARGAEPTYARGAEPPRTWRGPTSGGSDDADQASWAPASRATAKPATTREAVTRPSGAAASRRALTNGEFLKYWSGDTVSLFGSEVTNLALPLVAITTLSASAFQVGMLNAARFAPFIFISLFAGVWFDRHRRRPTLVASNLGRAVLIGLIPLAALLHLLSMNLLIAVGFLAGAFTVLFEVGVQAYLPRLVSPDQLPDANSKVATSEALAGAGGPGLGGVLVGAFTAPIALAADAASFLVAAVTLAVVRTREPSPPPAVRAWWLAPRWARLMHSQTGASIAEGLHAVFGNPILRHLALQSAAFNLFIDAFETVFPVYAVRQLGLNAAQLGLVLGAGSLGAVLGAVLMNRIRNRLGLGLLLSMSWCLSCGSPLFLLLPRAADPRSLVALGALLAVHNAGLAGLNINVLTLRQSLTPDRVLGRMNATYRLVVAATAPVGAIAGGLLAGAFGLSRALLIAAAGLGLLVLWLPFSPAFGLRTLPKRPPDTGADPDLPPSATSGHHNPNRDPTAPPNNRHIQATRRNEIHDDGTQPGTGTVVGGPAHPADRAAPTR